MSEYKDSEGMQVLDGRDYVGSARSVLAVEAAAIKAAAGRIGSAFVDAVATILSREGKVIVTGLGKSGHVARKIAATLSSTGTSAAFLHPSEALHGDSGMMQARDSLVAIAYGGETNEVLEVCRYARRIGVPIIGITGNVASQLGVLANYVLDGRVDREADPHGLAPTASSTVAMALGDALAVALMQAKGFSPKDFAALHPGGSLGRRLSSVHDHMHGIDQFPRLSAEADFHQVLEAVTQLNFGIAAIVDTQGGLIGAISDGDLRRALLKLGAQALSCDAKALMSTAPKTISVNTLALDAVAKMNDMRITSLFVTEGEGSRRVVGLLRLHDLLAAKIL